MVFVGRSVRYVVSFIVAFGLLMALSALPASAAFNATFSLVPSSTAANAHPDLVATTDFSGTPDVKTLAFALPNGLRIAPAAVSSPCSSADATAGNCQSSAKIGTVSATALGSLTASGDVFLTDSPGAGAVAGVAFKVTFSGGLGSLVSVATLDLNLNGPNQQAQKLIFGDLPNTTSLGSAIHLTQLRFVLNGATGGTAHSLITNPSSCPTTSQNATVSAAGVDGSSAQAVSAYPVTSCGAVPFAPVFDESFTDPIAGETTNASFSMTLPPGNGYAKILSVKFPPTIGWYFSAFGAVADMCPTSTAVWATSQFNPASCPRQAKIGSFALETPLLPTSIVGDVFAISQTPQHWIALNANAFGSRIAAIGTVSTPQVDPNCDAGVEYCQAQVRIVFSNLPQLPTSKLQVDFDGAGRTNSSGLPMSSKMLQFVGEPCESPSLSQLSATSYFGAAVSVVKSVDVSGC